MEERELEGRVAIITGGGRGFGKAFGHALSAHGAHVVLADIDVPAGEKAAAEIRHAGGEATAFSADVTQERQVAALVDHVVGHFGGIDILINNAGLHSAAYNEPPRRRASPRCAGSSTSTSWEWSRAPSPLSRT